MARDETLQLMEGLEYANIALLTPIQMSRFQWHARVLVFRDVDAAYVED